MDKPYLIVGGQHKDNRGIISFINDFTFDDVKRFYTIQHTDTVTVRAWQGHKIERRYFYCIQGSFWIGCVKIDNWENPSSLLKPVLFKLSVNENNILSIPPGYANGIRACEENSRLISYSTSTITLAKHDDFRFDKDLWINWSELK